MSLMLRVCGTGCAFDFPYGVSDNLPMETKTDFCQIIDELLDSGWTQQGIAEATGLQQSSVSALKCRKQTKVFFDEGLRLSELHKQRSAKVPPPSP